MARTFDGSGADYLSKSGNYLSASTGPWCIALWIKPASLSSGAGVVWSTFQDTSNYLTAYYDGVGAISIVSAGHSGTNPGNQSSITLDATDVSRGAFVAWVYQGQAAEYATWHNGTKTIRSAARSQTIATMSGGTSYIGTRDATGLYPTCTLAEVAVWSGAAPTDDQMAMLARGVMPDQIARGHLSLYVPMRGNSSPEPDYASTTPFATASAWTVTGTLTQATHPSTAGRALPLPLARKWEPAWVLDVYGDDQQYAATTDLYEDRARDTLGAVYPKTIVNSESIAIRHELSDVTHGVQLMSTATVLVANPYLTTPGALPGLIFWLEADQIQGYANGDAVTSFTERSPNGYSVTQATAAKKPIFTTNAINGLPALDFDGTDDFMAAANIDVPAWFTIFVAGTFTTTSGHIAVEHSANATTNNGFLFRGTSAGSIFVKRTAGTAGVDAAADWMGSTCAIASASFQSGKINVLKNSTVQAYDTDSLSNSIVTDSLYIGATAAGTSLFSNGLLYALIIVDHQVTDEERRSIEIYLATKLGVVLTPAAPQVYAPSYDYRGKGARLRRYDRISGEVMTELAGVVQDVQYPPGLAAITIGTHDAAELNVQLPRTTITADDFPSATDLGAPIPVCFGKSYMSPPFCGVSDPGDPSGSDVDYLVGHQLDAADAAMTLNITDAFADTDAATPGLERVVGFDAAPGTPTYTGTTTFTVTGDLTSRYLAGSFVRVVTTASNGVWVYAYFTTVAYTTLTTCTVNSAVLDSGMNTGGNIARINPTPTAGGTGYAVGDVLTISTGGTYGKVRVLTVAAGVVTKLALTQPGLGYTTGTGKATTGGTGSGCTVNILEICRGQLATDFITETSRYAYSTDNLQSVRFVDAPSGSPVLQIHNTSYNDHADVIAEILKHTTWGLAATINTASFTTAAAVLTTAGLANACNWTLGGDRQQHQAQDVFNELLMIRGGRLWKDSALAWYVSYDTEPASPWMTFELGGAYNNIVNVVAYTRTPLGDAVQTLVFRYGPPGVIRKSDDSPAWFGINQYLYGLRATVIARGTQERIITLPQITTYSAAARTLAYLAKRLRAEDEQIATTVGYEGRWLSIGDVQYVRAALYGLDKAMRVRTITRRLTTFDVQWVGYDATMYDFAAADVSSEGTTSVQTDDDNADPYIRMISHGDGANLLANPDFSVPLRYASPSLHSIPGWKLITPSSTTSLTITNDLGAVGGAYLTLVGDGVGVAGIYPVSSLTETNSPLAMYAHEGGLYIWSAYLDSVTDLYVQMFFYDSAGTAVDSSYPPLKVIAHDRNGLGWKRYYVSARAPRDTSASVPIKYAKFIMQYISAGTFKIDAVQFEESSGIGGKPTRWKRHAKWGIDPAALQPGALTIRRLGDPVGGAQVDLAEADVTCSGATSTATNLYPAGVFRLGATVRVKTLITGATSFNVGDGTDADLNGAAIAVAVGTRTTSADFIATTQPASRNVVLTAVGSNFTAGVVTVTAHFLRLLGPTN